MTLHPHVVPLEVPLVDLPHPVVVLHQGAHLQEMALPEILRGGHHPGDLREKVAEDPHLRSGAKNWTQSKRLISFSKTAIL